jgi:hypothetical protein
LLASEAKEILPIAWLSEALEATSRVPVLRVSSRAGSHARGRALASSGSTAGRGIQVGRYATTIDAKLAVDEAIATDDEPSSLRMVESPASGRILLVVGGLAVAVAVAIVL